MKNFIGFVLETLKIVIVSLAVVVPIRYFVFQPFIVRGDSMEPTFQTDNYLIIDELSYRLRLPQRGEVIVLKYPLNPSQRYLKRIIGLPGETLEIENGQVEVFNKEGLLVILKENSYLPEDDLTQGNLKIELKEDEYFVLGDNRQASSDSRAWGPAPRKMIVGRVFLRLWPLQGITIMAAPNY